VLRPGLAEHLAEDLASAVLPAFLQQHPGVQVELTRAADPGRSRRRSRTARSTSRSVIRSTRRARWT
jgi:hypothetical protein